jgi:hypothetical protein
VLEIGRKPAPCVLCSPNRDQARFLRALAAAVTEVEIRGRPRNDVRVRDPLSFVIFECIEAFYSRQRRHYTLGMASAAEYEQTQQGPPTARSNNQRPKHPVSSEPGQVRRIDHNRACLSVALKLCRRANQNPARVRPRGARPEDARLRAKLFITQ